jgi:hypothetical protein
VPSYLPALVVPLLPWARSHVQRVMRVNGLPAYDLWDETLTALLRASVYWQPDRSTTFRHYAQRAVNRACWRYVVSPIVNPSRRGSRRTRRIAVPTGKPPDISKSIGRCSIAHIINADPTGMPGDSAALGRPSGRA